MMENKTHLLRKLTLRATLVFFSLFIMSTTASAIFELPNTGIDYQTMQIADTDILKNAGMENIEKDDKVEIQITQDGKMVITNKRTGDKVTFTIDEE